MIQIIKTYRFLMLLSIASLGFLVSCEIQDNFEYTPSPDNSKLNQTTLEFISTTDSLSLMKEAIEIAGLSSIYDNEDGLTFIVPNNAAFRVYLKENKYASLRDIPLPILRNVLKYHIVEDVVNFNNPDLFASNRPIAYPTKNGQQMFLSHTSTFVGLINEKTKIQWQIRTSNLVANNGVIHVVNNIVYYSAPTGDANAPNPDLVQDTIFAKHDTYVNGGAEAGVNFGTNTLIKIKNVTNDGDYDRKGFLIFDFDDFKKEGVVTDMQMQLSVSFSHGKGVDFDLYVTPSTDWTESSLKFNNAVFPNTPRIATLKSSKATKFNFDITDYYKSANPSSLVSFMLDGQYGSDETDEIASKEHPTLAPPMIIATLSSGNSKLELEHVKDISMAKGDVVVLDQANLLVSGATAADIIYTIEELPSFGWLVKGAEVLKQGSRFSQLDIDLNNIVFIHDGNATGTNNVVLTARDRAGAILEDIILKIVAN